MIQDSISAKTYFFLLPYFFSKSVNTLRQNKVPSGGRSLADLLAAWGLVTLRAYLVFLVTID
jgi:hypothetical protein